MEASSSSFSSAHRSKQLKSEPRSLTSLLEELLLLIIAKVVTRPSHGGFFHVARVSGKYRRLSEDPSVLRSAHPRIYAYAYHISASYRKRLFQGCLASGNPDAQYVQKNADYFRNQRREIGLKLLISYAEQGHEKAIFVCGIMLLCLGGPNKQKGMKMLSTLIDSVSVYSSMYSINQIRHFTELHGWPICYADDTMRELKQKYVRAPCCCNGKTAASVEMKTWQRRLKDLPSSEACPICFWDNQVEFFFFRYDPYL